MRDIDPTASEYISSGYLARSVPGGVYYDPASLLSGGASIGSALLGSSSASDAANAQSAAAARTDATNRYIFDRQTQLQEPFRAGGVAANNRLQQLLGLGGTPGGAPTDRNALRQSLVSQFTTPGTAASASNGPGGAHWDAEAGGWFNPNGQRTMGYSPPPQSTGATGSTIDENGLNAAINARADQGSIDSSAPDYGSLMKRFGMSDFEADPGYEFRKQQGMQGIENSAASRGGVLSGGTLKAIQKYGQGMASQEYGNAYDRYNADNTNKYNRLAGVVNTGIGAANQISNAAGGYGAATASNNAALGNAQSASSIAQGNAWQNALGTIGNNYQQNSLMQAIQNPSNSWANGGSWASNRRNE